MTDHDEEIARRFHEAYERLAPKYSYTTRKASAVPWEQVPYDNRRLMIATVREVLGGSQTPGPEGRVDVVAEALRREFADWIAHHPHAALFDWRVAASNVLRAADGA